MMLFFFFQAEDGIRDGRVTGVQTCALPIFRGRGARRAGRAGAPGRDRHGLAGRDRGPRLLVHGGPALGPEIGRASCRERVEISVVAVSSKKKVCVALCDWCATRE